MKAMEKYLYTLLEEKGIDVEEFVTVGEDPFWGPQIIQLDEIVRFILKADKETQKQIRNKLVYIDFKNGDVMDLFKYIGRFMFAQSMGGCSNDKERTSARNRGTHEDSQTGSGR